MRSLVAVLCSFLPLPPLTPVWIASKHLWVLCRGPVLSAGSVHGIDRRGHILDAAGRGRTRCLPARNNAALDRLDQQLAGAVNRQAPSSLPVHVSRVYVSSSRALPIRFNIVRLKGFAVCARECVCVCGRPPRERGGAGAGAAHPRTLLCARVCVCVCGAAPTPPHHVCVCVFMRACVCVRFLICCEVRTFIFASVQCPQWLAMRT
jgi:hypothetical protein